MWKIDLHLGSGMGSGTTRAPLTMSSNKYQFVNGPMMCRCHYVKGAVRTNGTRPLGSHGRGFGDDRQLVVSASTFEIYPREYRGLQNSCPKVQPALNSLTALMVLYLSGLKTAESSHARLTEGLRELLLSIEIHKRNKKYIR